MAKPFEETVNIQQVDTRSGAASGLLSLADRIGQFSDQAFNVAGQRFNEAAVKRGKESAQLTKLVKKGGITQAPVTKEEHFIGGIEIKAHNKTLQAAYLASLSNDIKASIGELRIEHPDDSLVFNDKATALRNGILKSVDPSVQQEVTEFFDSRIIDAGLKVRSADVKRQNEEAFSEIKSAFDVSEADAKRAARNGDTLAAVESQMEAFGYIDALDIAEDQKADVKRGLERDMAEQTLRREFDILSDHSIQDSFDLIEEKRKKVPGGWLPEEWDSYLNSQNAEINRKASHIRKDLVAAEKEISKAASLARGAEFMDPDVPPDPTKSSQDRKDVNLQFNEVVAPGLQGQNAEQQIDTVEDFVLNTGIVPDALVSKMNASMRSGGTENVIIMSKIVNDLVASDNPSVLKDLPDQTRAVALQITSSVSAGLDIETATLNARENAYGLTASDKERIKIESQELRPQLPEMLEDIIDRRFDKGFFTMQPETSTAIQADFNVAVDSFMAMTGGDAEQSAQLAEGSIAKTWGANRIDGDTRMMKYAPSVFYSVPGVNDDWMEDQFNSDLAGFGDIDNFRLGVNIDTISTGQPTYPLMTLSKDGILEPVFDEAGTLIEWAPDFQLTREYKEMQGAPQKMTDEAIELKNKADRLKTILGQDTAGFI